MERNELRLMCIKMALEIDSDKVKDISKIIDKAQEIYKWITNRTVKIHNKKQ